MECRGSRAEVADPDLNRRDESLSLTLGKEVGIGSQHRKSVYRDLAQ